MPTSLHKTMTQVKPNSCEALTTLDEPKFPSSKPFPLPYLISITMPHPKVRIRVPKLLVKAMHRSKQSCRDAGGSREKKRWPKPKEILPKKVGAVFSNVFSNKRSPAGKLRCGDEQPHLAPPSPAVSKSSSMKETSKIEDGGKQGKMDEKKGSQPLKVPFPISGFFGTRKGLHFPKCKIKKASNTNGKEKIGRTRLMRKRVFGRGDKDEEDGEKEEGGEEELCKKRILMGEKCRPLNKSGTLHYDRNGILLPEVIPCEDL